MNTKLIIYIISGLLVSFILILGIWFLFFRPATPLSTTPIDTLFGNSTNNTTGVTAGTTGVNGSQPIASSGQISNKKVFEITEGPVAGAILVQTLHPTTTLARYVSQNDGHVYDLPLDVAGAVPRIVSNITIPGASRVIWTEQGSGAILQYLDNNIIKSVYLGMPAATTSTKITPVRIKFLPDNIIDLAASPNGTSVVYMLKTSSGADGYLANADGTGAKKVFSLPLSQVLIQWPTTKILLASTKSDFNSRSMLFTIDTTNGAVTPTLSGQGLTATADPSFSTIIYQVVSPVSQVSGTYIHNVKTSSELPLPFNPFPEQCIFGTSTSTGMYCAGSVQYIAPGFLDLWHQGVAGVANAIYSFDLQNDIGIEVASPGGSDGGVASDILEMSLSPNEKYLSFTTKGSRTLWGVRLGN